MIYSKIMCRKNPHKPPHENPSKNPRQPPVLSLGVWWCQLAGGLHLTFKGRRRVGLCPLPSVLCS